MIIAVNTRLLLKGKLDGIGWFTYETIKRITIQHPEHQFVLFFDRPFNEGFVFASNVTAVLLYPPARHPVLWYLFFEWSVTRALKKYKADIFVSPDGWLSLRSNVKSLAVIHDLNFEHFPQFVKRSHRVYLNYFFHRFAQKANRIATVSQYSKIDISEHYGITKDKIDVVYNGAHDLYRPVSEAVKLSVKARFTDNYPYFIFISTLHPRKNLMNLFKAFDLFRKNNLNDTKLVIVGQKQWWNGEISEAYNEMEFKNEVIFTGRLAPEILNELLASSLALTYVSYFEGFGIPIVEAFYAETAVITSNITSMPEIAGNAALLVDPYSITEIADAMQKIATDDEFRTSLIEKGKKRRIEFSWDKTAEKLWSSIEKIL
ncbi:MAG: glycosyltransferase family 4 protein [Bacteroidales bacterium]